MVLSDDAVQVYVIILVSATVFLIWVCTDLHRLPEAHHYNRVSATANTRVTFPDTAHTRVDQT